MPLDELMPRLLDLVVPALGDRCVVYGSGREPRVVGLRVAGSDAAPLEAAIRERPPLELPARARLLAEGELASFGARSGALLPLRARGQRTGAIMIASSTPEAYASTDLRYLQVFAGRLAVGLDNARLLTAERQLEALIGALDDAVTVVDPDGRIVMANTAAASLMGVASVDELLATPMAEMFERYAVYDPDGRPLAEDDLGWMSARAGEPNPPPLLTRRVDRATGDQRWLLAKCSILHDDNGLPAMAMYVTEDVTAVKRAELGQWLLAETGRLLSSSHDLDVSLQEVAQLTVPALADWCGIELPGPGGFLHLAAIAHIEPAKVAVAHRLRTRHPVHVDDEGAVASVIRTGTPARLDNITTAMVREAAEDDDEQFELLQTLGLSALLVVPLRSGENVLGALTLVASQPHRRFDDADLATAEALAQRIADALRNSRLLRDRSEIAKVLSAGLRPDESPVLPGCEVTAVYQPAGEDVYAGGDFYDVIDSPSGSIVVMGDVVGKGAPAAALSAVSRVTLRTAGRLTGQPAAALDELNHQLRRRGAMSLCTVVAIALPTALPGPAEVLLGGHPPPLLVRDGVASLIGETGPMLGAVEVPDWKPVTVELEPDDVIVLYTDGVLDSVLAGGERFGEDRLRQLAESSGSDVDLLAYRLEVELGQLRLRDDVAMLAIRCPGPPPLLVRGTLDDDEAESLVELTLRGGPEAPGEARHALAEALAGRLSARLENDALVVVSELVTNAIRHGGAGAATDEIGVHAAMLDAVLRVEVTDPGPGFEPGGHGPRPDGGYGLHLLDRLAIQWGVTGGEPVTVWAELAR